VVKEQVVEVTEVSEVTEVEKIKINIVGADD
jgi:hypothetical protein